MTSWISAGIPKKKVAPSPVSFFPYNQGSFPQRTPSVTVVTALYDEEKAFWKKIGTIPLNMIIFTEPSFADQIVSYRKGLEDHTQVITLVRSDWVAVKRFLPAMWPQQVKQDPEIRMARTIEDLHFNYEKKEFMIKAVDMNPFQTTDFIWVSPAALSSSFDFSTFCQKPTLIPTDRILVANPEAFKADDVASSYFRGKNRVDNTVIAGSEAAWINFSKLYELVMALKLRNAAFVGDDLE